MTAEDGRGRNPSGGGGEAEDGAVPPLQTASPPLQHPASPGQVPGHSASPRPSSSQGAIRREDGQGESTAAAQIAIESAAWVLRDAVCTAQIC